RRPHREMGCGRDGQAVAGVLHAPAPRAGRRLAADRPQGLLRLSRSVAENFARSLEASSRRTPEKLALVWDGGALTFGELDRRADAFAQNIAARGEKAGQRTALSIRHRGGSAAARV